MATLLPHNPIFLMARECLSNFRRILSSKEELYAAGLTVREQVACQWCQGNGGIMKDKGLEMPQFAREKKRIGE